MSAYSMRVQINMVVASIGIHNFLMRNGRLDEGFRIVEEVNDDEVEIDLLDEQDEIVVWARCNRRRGYVRGNNYMIIWYRYYISSRTTGAIFIEVYVHIFLYCCFMCWCSKNALPFSTHLMAVVHLSVSMYLHFLGHVLTC